MTEEMTIEEAFSSYGFSDKERRIYLAILELGTTTANSISEKADVNRSTTYDILKSFLERGIASKVLKGKTAYFEVASPERLVALLDEKKAKFEAVMPELKLMRQMVVEKPTVQVFEGKEGWKTILEDILETRKPTDVISTSKVFEAMAFYFPQYIKKRSQIGIKARVIQEKSPQTDALKKKDKDELRETRSLEDFRISSITWIYGDKVAIIKLVKSEIISVLISDKAIAEDNRRIFEILWNSAQ